MFFPPSFISATLCQQCQWVLLCLWLLSLWQHECSCLLYLPIPASVCDVTAVPSCGSTEVREVITLWLPELNIYIMLVSFYGGYCCFAYASSLHVISRCLQLAFLLLWVVWMWNSSICIIVQEMQVAIDTTPWIVVDPSPPLLSFGAHFHVYSWLPYAARPKWPDC